LAAGGVYGYEGRDKDNGSKSVAGQLVPYQRYTASCRTLTHRLQGVQIYRVHVAVQGETQRSFLVTKACDCVVWAMVAG
jgi:hypothetical protein